MITTPFSVKMKLQKTIGFLIVFLVSSAFGAPLFSFLFSTISGKQKGDGKQTLLKICPDSEKEPENALVGVNVSRGQEDRIEIVEDDLHLPPVFHHVDSLENLRSST